MDSFREKPIWGRLAIIFLLVALVGWARPRDLERVYQQAGRGFAVDNKSAIANSLQQALAYQPWRADLWRQAGDLALAQGQAEKAVQDYQQVIQLQGMDEQLQLALGEAYLAAGDLPSARQAWQQVPDISIDRLQRLVEADRAAQDYPAEASDLQRLLAQQPNDAQLTYRLGLLLAVTQPDQALEVLGEAARLEPAYHAAVQPLQAAILVNQDQELAYLSLSVGRALASLQEWELAGAAFHQATLARPDYAEAWAFLGEARQHRSSGPAVESPGLAELEKAHQLDPNSVAANTFLAFYWERQGRPENALPYLQTATTNDPQNPALQTELGKLMVLLRDLEAAQQAYQKAVELAPEAALYWRVLAEFSLQNQVQVRELALPAARQAVLLAPQDPLNLDLLGQTFLQLEDIASADRYFQRALELNPEYEPAHLHLAMSYILKGDMDSGRKELNWVLTQASDSPSAAQAQRLLERYFP